jgi:DmsE family decaheme c-type cytochrome
VGCHGPADAHVEGGGDPTKIRKLSALTPAERTEACTSCHNRSPIAHWTGGDHDAAGLDCTSCHNPHPKGAPREALLKAEQVDMCGVCHAEQRAKMFRSGHMPVRESRMRCTSCHNPHGTLSEHQLLQNSINDNCYTCHAEKRGPFLWEHEAVREDCVSCHDAHGSIHASMLKVKQPILCQSCHVFTRHPSTTHMANSRIAFNKSCLNCHSMIHGSNHPAGNYFTR